jgi:hypothetical protein
VDDRFEGVWLLERAEGVLLLNAQGWYSMQVDGERATAGHYGIAGDQLLLDPVVAQPASAAGQVERWDWSFDGDVLVLSAPDGTTYRWHREGSEVVTGLGTD